MNFFFGIPTYKRVDEQLTLAYLKRRGVERERIILATQTEEEYIACKERYDADCVVIFRAAHNLSGNRNTIIDYFPPSTNVLILDDDIMGFERNKNGTLVELSGNEFIDIADKMFEKTRAFGGKLWSVYPVRNAYFMEREPIIKFNRAIICVHGVITSDLRYAEEQTVKEDYLFVCENLAKGYPTLRLENVVANAKHLTNAGGCKGQWDTNDECYERVLRLYPQFVVANSKRAGEVLMRKNIPVGAKIRGLNSVRLF